ncbi:hypothetical protein C1H76_4199 [Elsinoe australis]|uniref:BTB domain-containing protein n=1 Tax=Elsinoe australis TaxID=40998 RepID=A0A4U7AYG3_9PEZI|nr:hypothetical protein C1H76_4199 [Elsinoe australis]
MVTEIKEEAEDKTIDLREDETSLVVALVKYIYGCQYNEILQPEEHAKLDVHVHLYGYADKFDYAPLRKAAFDYLSAKCVSLPFNAEMASAYLTAVNENCLAGGGAMLTVADQFVSRNIEGLSGLKPDAFTDISRDCPHLGRMVLTHFTTGRGKDTTRWNCKSCKNFFEVMKSVNPRSCPYCTVGAHSLSEVKSVASAGGSGVRP